MANYKRSQEKEYKHFNIGAGPYLARIVSHADSTFMGSLEVSLLRSRGNVFGEDTQTYIVRYASPFFGYTAFEYLGYTKAGSDTTEGYSDTQKSYGMWMVPPDVGVTVMVMFIDGDPSQGYWMGCVPDTHVNRMVPGIAASEPGMYEMDGSHKGKYAPKSKIPVAEINKRINGKGASEKDTRNIKKAMHPIVRWFYEEGLMDDEQRGVTTASARRDSPSMVFGISTPGPFHRTDYEGKTGKKGAVGTQVHTVDHWVSRLGVTQFVMDDGDDTQNRIDIPSKAPMEYVKDPGGKRHIPKDELVRIRTRTGHQLLFHNSEDLIYLGNARGTAWIEMSSDGKIDIYARDSISIHSQNDLNVRADRDINMEAGRNINMKATAEYKKDIHEAGEEGTTKNIDVKLFEDPAYKDNWGHEAGRIQMESEYNFNMLCGRDMKIQLRETEKAPESNHNLWIKVQGDMKIAVRDPDKTDGDHDNSDEVDANTKGLHIQSYEHTRVTTEKNTDIRSNTGHHYEYSGLSNETLSGTHIVETAPLIDMNGPQAAEAQKCEIADSIKKFVLYENDITDETLAWAGTRYQSDKKLKSIMRRIPMHEPWAPKENLDPLNLKPDKLDREEDHK